MPSKSVQDIYSRESSRKEKLLIAKEERLEKRELIKKRLDLINGITNFSETHLEDILLKKIVRLYVRDTYYLELENLQNISVSVKYNKVNYTIYLIVEVINELITLNVRKVI